MRRRDRPLGSHDRPYSALNLRLVLAGFGLVSCAVIGVLLWRAGWRGWAAAFAVLAVVALVDLIVVIRRRRRRHREHPEVSDSLFS